MVATPVSALKHRPTEVNEEGASTACVGQERCKENMTLELNLKWWMDLYQVRGRKMSLMWGEKVPIQEPGVFRRRAWDKAVGVWRSWNEEEMGGVGRGCEKLHIRTQALILSLRGQQTFSLKGQIVNTFLFVGYKEVSVIPTQFWPCSPGQPSSYVTKWAWLCSHKNVM